MSLVFSDTSTKRGIIQSIERRVFPGESNRISNNSTLLEDFTAEVNLAKDRLAALTLEASGASAPDDYTHTDYPIIYGNIVAGQRDYPILQDETGNNILDVYKLVIKDTNGNGREVFPVEVRQNDEEGNLDDIAGFYNGSTTQGVSSWYSRTANGIFLGYTPNYSLTNGIEAYISREPAYFLSTDTTKQSGFPGLFDDYLAIIPSWRYAIANNLANLNAITAEKQEMEDKIKNYYGKRMRDTRQGFRVRYQSNR